MRREEQEKERVRMRREDRREGMRREEQERKIGAGMRRRFWPKNSHILDPSCAIRVPGEGINGPK